MNDNEYSLENLGLTFLKHSKLAEKNLERDIERYRENYPNSSIPEHFKDVFNLSKALGVLTNEILDLKDKLSIHISFTHLNP